MRVRAASKPNVNTGSSSKSAASSNLPDAQGTESDKIADGEALESAVADFAADSNPFTLGAVPSSKKSKLSAGPTSPTNGIEATSGEGKEPVANVKADKQALRSSDALETVELTTPAGQPSKTVQARERPPPPAAASAVSSPAEPARSRAGEKSSGDEASRATSPARRLMNLAGGSRPAGRPEYRPRSALSLARRRMIATYLPFEWQKEIRKKAEDIPEQQFNYLLSTLAIATSAITGGTVAYQLWPALRGTVIWLFSADAVEARVLQVRAIVLPATANQKQTALCVLCSLHHPLLDTWQGATVAAEALVLQVHA